MDKVYTNLSLFIILSVILVSGFTVLSVISAFATADNSSSNSSNRTNLPDINIDSTSTNNTLNNISSHFIADVFSHKNFTGNSTTISENVPVLKGDFQDSISSIIISINQNTSSGFMVEVCEHKSYAGNCMILGQGEHDIQKIGSLNDEISSIRYLSPNTLELKNIQPGIITNSSN